jgi:hypothetical protein
MMANVAVGLMELRTAAALPKMLAKLFKLNSSYGCAEI